MIVVKIELWPKGGEEGMQELGRVIIANDLTGNRYLGHYKVRGFLPGQHVVETRVRDHHREKGWIPLVDRAFGALQRAGKRRAGLVPAFGVTSATKDADTE